MFCRIIYGKIPYRYDTRVKKVKLVKILT